MDVAIKKVIRGFSYESSFGKSNGVREYKLKDVAAGLDINSEAERIMIRRII